MKKKVVESDFIGGQGILTREEETALSQFFARKKSKVILPSKVPKIKTKSTRPISVS
jgi:hypothetical protein